MTEILLIWLSWRRFFLSGIKEMKILLERSLIELWLMVNGFRHFLNPLADLKK